MNLLAYGRRRRGPIRSVETITSARQPMHTKRHANQGTGTISQSILFREQLHPLDPVCGQQPQTKGPSLASGRSLSQKQPQMVTAAASLQICESILASQHLGQVTQAFLALWIVCVEDQKPHLALLVEQIGAQSDLTPQVTQQETYVQELADADIAPSLSCRAYRSQRWTNR